METKGRVQPGRTCVVTVTYGNRSHLLEKVMQGVLDNGIERLIVVDNGMAAESRRRLDDLITDASGRIDVLETAENRGTAAGFGAGLARALRSSDLDFVWLLDDDNVPAAGALAALCDAYSELLDSTPSDQLMLLALREDRIDLERVARGEPPARVFPRRSSFLGFHWMDLPRKVGKWLRPSSRRKLRPLRSSPVEIPFAPYGGLFFHKSVIQRAGYPDERFYLYGDDTEFTHRFVAGGGRLYLVPSSRVADLHPSWHVEARRGSYFLRLLLAEAGLRVYYSVRNQVNLELSCWRGSRVHYHLNKWLFFLGLGLCALLRCKWSRFALVWRAVKQGAQGNLGRVDPSISSGRSHT